MLKITGYRPIYNSNIRFNGVSKQQNSFKESDLSDYPLDSYVRSTITNSDLIVNDRIKTIKDFNKISNEVENLINHSSQLITEIYDYVDKNGFSNEDHRKQLVQVLNDGTVRKTEFVTSNSEIYKITEKSKDTIKEYDFHLNRLYGYYESTKPNDNEEIVKFLDFIDGKLSTYKITHKSELSGDEYDIETYKTFEFNTQTNKPKRYTEHYNKRSSGYGFEKIFYKF